MMSNELTLTSSPKPNPISPQAELVQTLAKALAGHIGTQHSGRGDLSQNTGKAFTQLLMEKHKATQNEPGLPPRQPVGL